MAAHRICQSKSYRITEEVRWQTQSKWKELILHMVQVSYRFFEVQNICMSSKDN